MIIADDSAFIRSRVREMIDAEPDLEVVGAARNGLEALGLVQRETPDVVVTDLSMPGLDGIGFIKQQLARELIPILVLSVASEEGSRAGEAIDAGAFEFISKPTGLFTDEVLSIRDELLDKIRIAAGINRNYLRELVLDRVGQMGKEEVPAYDLIVLGLSTGGPRALEAIVRSLPSDLPIPLAAVVHMPVGYTGFFAQRLNRLGFMEVVEAEDGVPLVGGRLVLGKAGTRFRVARGSSGLLARVDQPLPGTLHRPSVDDLFKSAAMVLEERVAAFVLTGMGEDGKEGAAWIASQGGRVVAEAEESCVVFGMPRAVIEAGLADHVVPLEQIPGALVSLVGGHYETGI